MGYRDEQGQIPSLGSWVYWAERRPVYVPSNSSVWSEAFTVYCVNKGRSLKQIEWSNKVLWDAWNLGRSGGVLWTKGSKLCSLKIHNETLTPIVIVFGNGASGRYLGLNEFTVRLVTLEKEKSLSLSCSVHMHTKHSCEYTSRRWPPLTQKRPQNEIYLPDTLILNFSQPKWVEQLRSRDRTTKKKLSKEMAWNIINQLNLIDIHRIWYLTTEECTFFSHRTFSNTDHILGHKTYLDQFRRIEITQDLFSDYRMKLEICKRKKFAKHTNMWKLNSTLLTNGLEKKSRWK